MSAFRSSTVPGIFSPWSDSFLLFPIPHLVSNVSSAFWSVALLSSGKKLINFSKHVIIASKSALLFSSAFPLSFKIASIPCLVVSTVSWGFPEFLIAFNMIPANTPRPTAVNTSFMIFSMSPWFNKSVNLPYNHFALFFAVRLRFIASFCVVPAHLTGSFASAVPAPPVYPPMTTNPAKAALLNFLPFSPVPPVIWFTSLSVISSLPNIGSNSRLNSS